MINSAEGLDALVEKALLCDSVALDTEFVWEKTYYPILGLIQVGYPDGSVDLIDTVALKDLRPLGRLIKSPNTTKILHDALQDLVILNRATQAIPKAIFDTQKAAGFIGLSSTISLSDLLKNVLSVYIKKSETKSNWIARPLTDSQLQYAEEDVSNGVALMQALMRLAGEQNRSDWVLSEMHFYESDSHYQEPDPLIKPARVKRSGGGGGSGALNQGQKTMLRSLAAWRAAGSEKECRS